MLQLQVVKSPRDPTVRQNKAKNPPRTSVYQTIQDKCIVSQKLDHRISEMDMYKNQSVLVGIQLLIEVCPNSMSEYVTMIEADDVKT